MYSINQIWKHDKEASTPMLSNYNAEWWSDYVTDYDKYDAVFRRLYYSFYPFMQGSDEELSDVCTNFTADVRNLLMVHAQEFAQLYRVQELELDAYGITDNYDMTETLDKDTSESIGARQDGYSDTLGAQQNSSTGKVSPYDSENFYNDNSIATNVGQRSDSGTASKGSQSNSGSEDYTLTRKGNIGVSTSTDVMGKHVAFWEGFNFYHYVFGVIAKELLTVNCGGYDYAD